VPPFTPDIQPIFSRPDPVEPEADQCLALLVVPPARAADLHNLEGLDAHEGPS
jgi:hypothetical protein